MHARPHLCSKMYIGCVYVPDELNTLQFTVLLAQNQTY